MVESNEKQPQKLVFLGLIVSFLALLAELLSNLNKTLDASQKHFYISLAVVWLATLIFAFSAKGATPKLTRRIRWIAISATTILVLALLGHRYEHSKKITYPAVAPDIRLQSSLSVSPVFAAEQPLRLDSFYLNTDLSSFHQIDDSRFGAGPLVNSYQIDLDVGAAFRRGQCIGVSGEQPARAAVPVLRSFWTLHGRTDLSA